MARRTVQAWTRVLVVVKYERPFVICCRCVIAGIEETEAVPDVLVP